MSDDLGQGGQTQQDPGVTGKAASAAAASLLGGPDHGQQAATSAQQAFNKRRDELNRGGNTNTNGMGEGIVVLPQGGFARVSDYLDHDYIAENHSSIFAEPSRFMEDPDPECMYVWAAKSDKHTFARIRSHMYEPVTPEELREDTDLPIETHRVAGIEDLMVACYDLVLLRVPPKAVKRLYKWREMQAVMRTQTNLPFQQLKAQVEQESRGLITAEKSISVE